MLLDQFKLEKEKLNLLHDEEKSLWSHLNDADWFPGEVVGCVEEEREEENKTTIPAKHTV